MELGDMESGDIELGDMELEDMELGDMELEHQSRDVELEVMGRLEQRDPCFGGVPKFSCI